MYTVSMCLPPPLGRRLLPVETEGTVAEFHAATYITPPPWHGAATFPFLNTSPGYEGVAVPDPTVSLL